MRGFSNPHFQTLAPSLLNRRKNATFVHERFELDDGDFLDLAWQKLPQKESRPIVVIFHGLEGSVYSPYAFRMMKALEQQGFNAVVMHFRGCFDEPNRLARAYHSGETGDAKSFLAYLRKRFPDRPLGAIGYSLGGNMLIKLQGELGEKSPLFAAVSVSAPLRLEQTATHINSGVSRFYQAILMADLRKSLLEKFAFHDYETMIGLKKSEVAALTSFWEYDNRFTGPVHGFKDAEEYYARSSAQPYVSAITKPTLIIHAEDDPFMPTTVLPDPAEIPESVSVELCRHGGHVGFVGGSLFRPVYWLEKRIPEYLKGYLRDLR